MYTAFGLIGIFVAGFRFIARTFVTIKNQEEIENEPLIQKIFFGIGILLLLAIGLFPSIFLNPFENLLLTFQNLN